MGKWVVDYIQNVSSLLSQITTYREKDQITFASSQWFFTSLICIQSSELHSIAKPQAFLDLKILVLGASLSRNKSLSIPEDLVNEETINGEVIVRGGPMSGSYSTSTDAENSFILNSHILAKLRKELKNKMNFKTDSNFKKSTPSEIRKHEDQIATLIGSLNNYSNPFHEVAWNMTTGAEIPGNIINGLPSGRKYATERAEQFTKKRLLSQEVSFYDPTQRITIATLLKKKKQRKVISVLKEQH